MDDIEDVEDADTVRQIANALRFVTPGGQRRFVQPNLANERAARSAEGKKSTLLDALRFRDSRN